MVVDCCLADKGGQNLTCALLSRLGIQKGEVDLLVITHADEDHIGGMCRLIDDFDPRRIWYSPFVQSVKAFVSVWRGAFHGEAWVLHAKKDGATTVLVAPFNRSAKLPDSQALDKLTDHSALLGVTKDVGGSFERAKNAGWKALAGDRVRSLDDSTGLVAVTLDRGGERTLFAAKDACFFDVESKRKTAFEALFDGAFGPVSK